MVDDEDDDDGRTPDHGHPISSPCEPNGSGELKRLYLCHIHVSGAYRSRMRISIRRGLRCILFKRRMYHIRVTFLLCSRGVSVTNLFLYGISLSYVRHIKAYVLCTCDVIVWRMKCTCDVSTAYVLRSILICGVSVLYQLLLVPMRTNGCVHFVHAICTLQLSIIRGRTCPRRNLDNLD